MGSRNVRSGSAAIALAAHTFAASALAVGTLAACAPGEPAGPAEARHAFDAGDAGWAQYEALADKAVGELGRAWSVKVLVFDVRSAQPTVWFVPARYALHWEFAHARDKQRFPDRNAFDAQVYHDKAHPHLAATLVWYRDAKVTSEALPPAATGPLTFTFFGSDDVSFDLALAGAKVVLAAAAMVPRQGLDRRLVLMPANVTLDVAVQANKPKLLATGVPWLLQTELFAGISFQAMNPGVTFGTLRLASATDLSRGLVSYRDIAVLDRLPLDLPLVGGTITEELQTPLAHVNVVAKARQTPNLALKHARLDPKVAPLLGKPVRFEVGQGTWSLRAATVAEVEAFWKKKTAGPENHPTANLKVTAVAGLDEIGFSAAAAYGVKASNYAELHNLWRTRESQVKAITFGLQSTFTPGGVAVPFARYEDHLLRVPMGATDCAASQAACVADPEMGAAGCASAAALCEAVVTSGQPPHVKAYIAALLARPELAADSGARRAALHGIRQRIRAAPVEPGFAAELDAKVAARFPPSFKLRLRSSTNAEDLEGFSGAGLYESHSAESTGAKRPSQRITRTWASVWTFRAFEERSFWRVGHLDVRMGVLIHQAWPDESANGVLITKNIADPGSWGYYLNIQQGEESVTNPLGGITPEIVVAFWNWDNGVFMPKVQRLQWSSLSPGVPILDDAEVGKLVRAMHIASAHFAGLYGKTEDKIAFDVEWKIHDLNRNLYLKQLRPF
ncbi:MAG: hypothetical protein EXR79_04955 [Myxococcales bacterium]|nr:hypothetical protein [Myxococcales bacterium]